MRDPAFSFASLSACSRILRCSVRLRASHRRLDSCTFTLVKFSSVTSIEEEEPEIGSHSSGLVERTELTSLTSLKMEVKISFRFRFSTFEDSRILSSSWSLSSSVL